MAMQKTNPSRNCKRKGNGNGEDSTIGMGGSGDYFAVNRVQG
jgi:hypothetical protein